MGTFVDPRIEGAKMSASSKDNLVELLTIHNEEWLFYPSFPIQVALIRGTVADEFGNLTLEKKAYIWKSCQSHRQFEIQVE